MDYKSTLYFVLFFGLSNTKNRKGHCINIHVQSICNIRNERSILLDRFFLKTRYIINLSNSRLTVRASI